MSLSVPHNDHSSADPSPAPANEAALPRVPLARRLRVLLLIPLIAVLAAGFYSAVQLIQPTQKATATGAGSGQGRGSPEKVNTILDSARSYLRKQEIGKAEAILRQAVSQYPGEQSLHLLYGETLLLLGRDEDAYQHYAQAVIIGPDHPEYRFAAGTVANKLGLTTEAEKHYILAQQLDPSNPKYPLYLGQIQRKLGKVSDARKSLTDAVRLDDSLSMGWASLASIAMEDGSLKAARDYIGRARRLDSSSNLYRLIEARILRRDNRADQAAELLMAIPESDRLSDPVLLSELAMCFGLMNRPAEAAAMYVEAANRNPQDAELAYQAALWLQRTGNAERATTYAEAAAARGHAGAKGFLSAR